MEDPEGPSPARGAPAGAGRRGAGGLAVALAAFAGWEATLGRFSLEGRVGVGAAIGAALLLALATGRGRQRKPSATWAADGGRAAWAALRAQGPARAPAAVLAGLGLWVVVVLGTIGWDVTSVVRQLPSLPTLSRLVGDVTRHDWGRGLLVGAWGALGAYLAAGWRRPVSTPEAATPASAPGTRRVPGA